MHLKSCCALLLLALVACKAAPSTSKITEKKSISEEASKIIKEDLKPEEAGAEKDRTKKSATTFCVEIHSGTKQQVPCNEQQSQPMTIVQPMEPAPQPIVIQTQPTAPAPLPVHVIQAQPAEPAPLPIHLIHAQPTAPAPRPVQMIQAQPAAPAPQPVQVIQAQPAAPAPQPVQVIQAQPVAPAPQTVVIQPQQPTPAPIKFEAVPQAPVPQEVHMIQVQPAPQPQPQQIVVPVSQPIPEPVQPVVNILPVPTTAGCSQQTTYNIQPAPQPSVTVIQQEPIKPERIEEERPVYRPKPESEPAPSTNVEILPVESVPCNQEVVVVPPRPMMVVEEQRPLHVSSATTYCGQPHHLATDCNCSVHRSQKLTHALRHHPKVHEQRVMMYPTAAVAPVRSQLLVQPPCPLSYLSANANTSPFYLTTAGQTV